MIGFFPDPYPDELLYSVFARYHECARYPSVEATLRDLFGTPNIRAVGDLPGRIDSLVELLPPSHGYTADDFIDDHTMFPFYSPFLHPERLNLVRQAMRKGAPGGRVHRLTGIVRFKIKLRYFRFCHLCVEEDRKQFGATYWHRVHQAPGIEVCPHHAVFLSTSTIAIRGRLRRESFITAEKALQSTLSYPSAISECKHEPFLLIAQDVHWLLNKRGLSFGHEALRSRYHKVLYHRGAASFKGVVRHVEKLQAEIITYYTADLLKYISCDFESSDWVRNLLQKSQGKSHPVHHLLLIRYLQFSLEEFLQLPERNSPFGEAPWPCLNLSSNHYRENRIWKCKITDTHGTKRLKRPVGEFRCDCGFVYRRSGPDESAESRFKISKIMIYGPVWEHALIKLWRSGLSPEKIGQQLGVWPDTVKSQAKRLGLLHPLGITENSNTLHYHEKAYAETASQLEDNRRRWLISVAENPGADRATLKAVLPSVYRWLTRHDPGWIDNNSPPRRKHIPTNSQVDWGKRDAEFVIAVREAASRIINSEGRPIRVSVAAIGRDAGGVTWLLNRRDRRLPLTNQILEQVTETHEKYAVRRIRWAAECYRMEGIRPNKWDLYDRAAVSPNIQVLPDVKDAIAHELRSFDDL